ncbi:MAG: pilus assembly PilX N-terminal domain-containing protein [Rubrivivax sp.]|nr:pilus assembly PilX N-terminal domain-containing protein [Pyrinomonadaceae bacterium]
MFSNNSQTKTNASLVADRKGERGGALAVSMIVLALIAVVAISVLATVSNEARIAGGDLRRTQTCYVAAAKIEDMTSEFSALFNRSSRPAPGELDSIRDTDPTGLLNEGFTFKHTSPDAFLQLDSVRLTEMRSTQNITNNSFPRVTIPTGPYAGLSATIAPYEMAATATHTSTNTQCKLQRDINNYLIPLFQFGMFSDKDIELHPGPAFVFNGRVHANGNIYVNGNVKFLDKVTTANEIVTDKLRNDSTRTGASVSMQVGTINVSLTKGSVNNGPNFTGATAGTRGYFPGSPDGTANTTWEGTSVAAAAASTPNRFGGQLQTRTTGATALLLPLQLDGNPTREIIKRKLTTDSEVLGESRYHSKSEIRILLDDEGVAATMNGGIPTDALGNKKGVALSTWVPTRLGRKVLHRYDAAGADIGSDITQKGSVVAHDRVADAVRGVAGVASTSTVAAIPTGAPLRGRIYIEVVPPATTANPTPTPIEVTQTILSMGITEGEPNAIVMLQRPMWAAFTQGDRDATGGTNFLTSLFNNTSIGADGEIKINVSKPVQDTTYGFLTQIEEDSAGSTRSLAPPAVTDATNFWNAIVPINLYNVREGYTRSTLASNVVYERGITSVVEINMKNFARWVDGVYDASLLASTSAVSANIDGSDGYILYISDRRGDRVKSEKYGTTLYDMTNGLADNEDIYGPNGSLDPGEDVIDAGIDGATAAAKKGIMQKDTAEVPDPAELPGTSGADWSARFSRAKEVATYPYNLTTYPAGFTAASPMNYFRRAVRVVNGDVLTTSMTGSNKLSQTKGISVATENMLYIWGNYNTNGISAVPSGGASLAPDYTGPQVPASLVSDAIFPLSKTWFDASPALYPENLNMRIADLKLNGTAVEAVPLGAETSVRAAVIAGTNMSALAGDPDANNGGDSRLSGGVHNFPRFLEGWLEGTRRWNYIGSLVPMYYSTQALSPWQYPGTRVIYGAPIRNWAFDDSFRDPNRLPPGTPMFQYIEPTGFRQVL